MNKPMVDFDNLANSASAPFRAFADDPLGFLLRGVDNGQRVPVTKTRTSYGLTLHAVVGNRRGVIGAVHEITTSQSLQLDEEYEMNALAKGLPRELVPQIVTNRTIGLKRYDLYAATLEKVFGTPELLTLADQLGPVSMRFMWKSPEPSDVGAILANNTRLSVYEYTGCYITNLTRNIGTANVIVGADATLTWTGVRQLQ